jgi:hypothetical protein
MIEPTVDKRMDHMKSCDPHAIGKTDPTVPPMPIHTHSMNFAIDYEPLITPRAANKTRQVTPRTTTKKRTRYGRNSGTFPFVGVCFFIAFFIAVSIA